MSLENEKENGALFGLGLLLIEEIKELNKTTKEWKCCKDYMIPKIFNSGLLGKLPMLVRLAVSVVIINSQAVDLFRVAFRITCEWEEVPNVIPLLFEIWRNAAIYYVEKGFVDTNGDERRIFDSPKARLCLFNAFSVPGGKPLEAYIKTDILKERMTKLQKEINDLIDSLHSDMNPVKQMEIYKLMHPITQLTTDYNNWAVKLFRRRSDLMTLEKLHIQGELTTTNMIRVGQCSDQVEEEALDSFTDGPKHKQKRER